MNPKRRVNFHFPRAPLLVEIDRRCTFMDCAGRNQVGLTKSEAIEYRGFDCSHCERWNDDQLNPGEVPGGWLDPKNQQS